MVRNMVSNRFIQAPIKSSGLAYPLIQIRHCPENSLPCLPSRCPKRVVFIKAVSANSENNQPPSSWEAKAPLSAALDVPCSIWKQALHPLSDLGFGRRNIWEGGVGIFIVSSTLLLALGFSWLKGYQIRSKFRKYLAVFEFPHASGICTGTPVRIRGVNVGNVICVNPSLKNIEAVVEVDNDKVIIPRNSFVEINQSGLLMESMIDITPRDPIPALSVGPCDPECDKEGLIVCDRQKIKGFEGVSLDVLVGIFARIGRDLEEIGISNTYELAKRAAAVIEEARPLLLKIRAMSEDSQPLLSEIRGSGLLKEVESLTRSLTEASEDLRVVHSSIMTPDNTKLIQNSIHNLIYTLKNVESISSDISGITGDEATKRNLKLLIKSLSRLL